MQNEDFETRKRQDKIMIGVTLTLAAACWAAGWYVLMVILFLFALVAAALSTIGHSLAEQREERRQAEILDARWHLIEAAEDVISAADSYRVGMPPEMHKAIERLRGALRKEGLS
jgi:hypothetical protein